ncbi:MAG: hypothetical protein Q4F15_01215 [Bacillota bacterium]|nr:hypothetical protein [Bacillota bacterium]
MDYPEFSKYKLTPDKSTLSAHYLTEKGHSFYVEPGFYMGLLGYKEKRLSDYPRILEAIYQIIDKEERVVFTGDFESPFTLKEGYIYKEIGDITDPLGIFVEDKSRGSDYGD